jgi:Uma2 family endonuclease
MDVMARIVSHPITAEQLLGIRDDRSHRFELVDGRLVVMEPSGFAQAIATSAVTRVIGGWIADRRLGVSLTSEPGFILRRGPDTVRAPDFAFIRAARVPSPPPDGYPQMTPDFAVEVVGKDDRAADVDGKARMWLAAGVGELWVVDPRERTATVHLPDRDAVTFADDEEIAASGPLSGFACRVADLLGS